MKVVEALVTVATVVVAAEVAVVVEVIVVVVVVAMRVTIEVLAALVVESVSRRIQLMCRMNRAQGTQMIQPLAEVEGRLTGGWKLRRK